MAAHSIQIGAASSCSHEHINSMNIVGLSIAADRHSDIYQEDEGGASLHRT